MRPREVPQNRVDGLVRRLHASEYVTADVGGAGEAFGKASRDGRLAGSHDAGDDDDGGRRYQRG
jgi:hypothetical protein